MPAWFEFNGIDSRNMGLWVTRLPPPTRAEERVETVEIPGRAGHLTIREGVDVHKSHLMECIVQAPSEMDFKAVLTWLSGSGTLRLSNNANRVYEAEITDILKFDKISNSIKEATIPFFVQPHMAQYPTEADITITGTTGTVTNPGNVHAEPLIEITYTGSVQIFFGQEGMAFTSIPGKIIVDCAAGIVTDANGLLWDGIYSGDFWKIKPGESTYLASEACDVKITPRWRWK